MERLKRRHTEFQNRLAQAIQANVQSNDFGGVYFEHWEAALSPGREYLHFIAVLLSIPSFI